MKRIFSVLFVMLSAIVFSCERTDFSPSTTNGYHKVTLTLIKGQEPENTIKNINLYAYCPATGISDHIYSEDPSSSIAVSMPSGSYNFYAVANTGKDLGAMSENDLKSLAYHIDSQSEITQSDCPVMSGKTTKAIVGATSVSLVLSRLTAKLTVNCSVAQEVSGRLKLLTLEILSVPAGCRYFSANNTDEYEFLDYKAVPFGMDKLSESFYVQENLRGENKEISSPQEKTAAYAPKNSTYIRIRGIFDGTPVTYSIYPGENDTDNFDILRNKEYNLNITVYGAGDKDYRVSTYSMSLTPFQAVYKPGDVARTSMLFSSRNNTGQIYALSTRTLKGEGRLVFTGLPVYIDTPIPFIAEGETHIVVPMTFAPPPAFEGDVEVEVTVHDGLGGMLTKTLATKYSGTSPIEISTTAPTTPYAYSTANFLLNITQENYTGRFTVEAKPTTAADKGSFKFGTVPVTGIMIFPNVRNSTSMSFTAGAFTGMASMKLTVTNDKGESAIYFLNKQIKPLPVKITPNVTYGWKKVTVTGGTRLESYVDLTYLLDNPSPFDLELSHQCNIELETVQRPITLHKTGTTGTITVEAGQTSVTKRIYYCSEQAPVVNTLGGVEQVYLDGMRITDRNTLTITSFSPPETSYVNYLLDGIQYNRRDI